jgi:DNA-binding transcriptional LysR family regulator
MDMISADKSERPGDDLNGILKLRRLDLNLLLTFDVLMKTRSATSTAKLLHKTQPGISRELAKLRHALSDRLLVPVKGKFVPTERAIELHSCVHDILVRLESAVHSKDVFDPFQSKGIVNIGAGGYLELLLAAPLLRRIGRDAPELIVRFLPLHGDFAADDLDAERMDIALGTFPAMAPRFDSMALFSDQRVCVVARDHPLAKKTRITMSEVPRIRSFAFSQMYGRETNFDRASAGQNSRLEFSAFLSGFGLAPYVLMDTDFATTMPKFAVRILSKYFPLTTINLPKELDRISYSMAWARRQHSSPLHRWLRQVVQDVIEEERGSKRNAPSHNQDPEPGTSRINS